MDAQRRTMLLVLMRKVTLSLLRSPALPTVALCMLANPGPTAPTVMPVPTSLPTLSMPTWDGLSRDIATAPSPPPLLPSSMPQLPSADGTTAPKQSPSTNGLRLISQATLLELVFARTKTSTSARDGPTVCGARWLSTSQRLEHTGKMLGLLLESALMPLRLQLLHLILHPNLPVRVHPNVPVRVHPNLPVRVHQSHLPQHPADRLPRLLR
jgi:hypothetical protein